MRVGIKTAGLILAGIALLGIVGLAVRGRLVKPKAEPFGKLLGRYAPEPNAVAYDESAPDDRQQAAETADYALYVHGKAGGISVEDRRTGYVWSSLPPGPEGRQSKYTCPLSLSYVNTANNVFEASNLTYSGLKVSWRKIPAGALVIYDVSGLKIKLTVEYRLTAEGLAAIIPAGGIGESNDYRLVALRLLKNFGALPPDVAGGGLFVPDGCGVIRGVRPHKENLTEFGAYCYGPDYAVNRQRFALPLASAALVPLDWKMPEFSRALSPRENLTLPVFGIYGTRGAMLGIIERGDTDCAIMSQDDGPVGVNYYRVGPEFYYRKVDEISVIKAGQRTRPGLGNQGETGMVQRTQVISTDPVPIRGERRVAYCFLPPGEAGYGALAARYRRYLRERGILPEKTGLDQSRLQISLLCAVDQNHQAGRRLRVMTTFAQAGKLVEKLRAAGADPLTVTLVGWQRWGLNGRMPVNVGAEPKLGGDAGLRRFIDFCHRLGVKVQLELDYAHAYIAWRSYDAARDVARTRNQDGILVDGTNPVIPILAIEEDIVSSRRYLTNPRAMWENYVRAEKGPLDAYGADGYVLRTIGRDLWSDLSLKHHLTRGQAVTYWRRILDALRAGDKTVTVEYGQGYLLGHVDGVAGLALADSGCTIFDEAVPFLPMVYSGAVPYWGTWGNLRADGRRQFLQELSYGAFPRYMLSYRSSEALLDTTLEVLPATGYEYWFRRIVEEWRELDALRRTLPGRTIVSYTRPQPGCGITGFSGGYKLLVNATEKPAVLQGRVVDSASFALTQEVETP